MGGIFSPNVGSPPPPPPVPPAAIPATAANPSVQQAGANQLAKAAAAGAYSGTVKTGSQGDLVKPPTATASLTG